ncbi:MAG: prenyltransferase/squalene oxidase repeat-containing protein, partial [Planctomycetota bacterium]
SFAGLIDGREVEIGVVYDRSDEPETDDEISDIPLGGTGVVGDLGIGGGGAGLFGFRTGGGRRRAAIRHGGSRRSEAAVWAAHGWLARNQESDGRWSSVKLGGREGFDVAVTGLATLSLLGAGHTEKTVRRNETVRKAVAWLVSNQTADGCLADDAAKRAGRLGTSHAIAGLALAEAYGMARVTSTGIAAQKAIPYSIDSHERKYSGWGEKPKGDPDTLVTGWFIAQLKSAKIAGLRVEGRGFMGSVSWLDKVTDFPDKAAGRPGGAARIRPREAPSPTATAIATFALQVMGWKRDDARVGGGSDFVLAHLLGNDARKLDHEFLYWGSLAMFQMGGERWMTWNARVRDTLITTQREGTGDPLLDGSWDPVAAEAELGRVGATALASMCLEVYYRYLPLYEKRR